MMPLETLSTSQGRPGMPGANPVLETAITFGDILNKQSNLGTESAAPLIDAAVPATGDLKRASLAVAEPLAPLSHAAQQMPATQTFLALPTDATSPQQTPGLAEVADLNSPEGRPLADGAATLLMSLGLVHGTELQAVRARRLPLQTSPSHGANKLPEKIGDDDAKTLSEPEVDKASEANSLVVSSVLVDLVSLKRNSEIQKVPSAAAEPAKAASSAPVLLTGHKAVVDSDIAGIASKAGEQGHSNRMEILLEGLVSTPATLRHPALGEPMLAKALHVAGGDSSITPDMAGFDAASLDLLMRDISELTSSSAKASFHLASENLGRMEVKLATSEAGVSVAIKTDNERGHAAVSQAQRQLHDDMQTNGLRISETSIALSNGETARDRSHREAPARFQAPIEVALERRDDEQSNPARSGGRFA